jgi:hypothetical protein
VAAQQPARRSPFLTRLLTEDPDLRERVEAAERIGISLRRFEGWEPTTFYDHDDSGRLVSSTPEVEWDDAEQGWMLALGLYRSTRCTRCSGDLLVTTDSENEDRFHHQLAVECYRCQAFDRSQEANKEHPYPLSLMHQVPHKPGR